MKEFYIGYLPQAPTHLARVVRGVVLGVFILASGLAIGLVVAQRPFAAAFFEFGKPQRFQGVIETVPYPVLISKRPGGAGVSRYTLVAPGKHGADDLVQDFSHREVELQGMLIFREGVTLVEVVPGTVKALQPAGLAPSAETKAEDLGQRTLTGEIVDTKCYAGVMNPGSGKVHRDCAARCISGGIPPALLSDGNLYYLVSPSDLPIGRDVLDQVGQPVTISGHLWRRGEISYLRVTPSTIACARAILKH